MTEWWQYDQLESGHPYDWHEASRGEHFDDNIDFHIDLGGGNIPKARLNIDRHDGADIQMDLNSLSVFKFGDEVQYVPPHKRPIGYITNPILYEKRLPFPDNSIESIISHHCLEHIGDGFIKLMDECYRVMKPGAKFRIIVPLFPSLAAVEDPDHARYFCLESFESFCHEAGPEVPFWYESFAEPYTKCRFHMTDKDYTPADDLYAIAERENCHINQLNIDDLFKQGREIRVTLQKPEMEIK